MPGFRDDEIPDNYLQLRDRGYGSHTRQFRAPRMPNLADMLHGGLTRGAVAVEKPANAVTMQAAALRRALLALLRGK